MFKQFRSSLIVAAAGCFAAGSAVAQNAVADSPKNRVIAIDVLLEPDAAMVKKCVEVNARLRMFYPAGYTLGSEHAAHITLVHRYVREKDLPAIEAAVTKVVTAEKPLAWNLTATGYTYGVWAGVAVTTIAIEPTPRLSRLQTAIVKVVEPFAVTGGTADAFSRSRELPTIDDDIIKYVEKFVPNSSGKKFNPHITVGVANEDFAKKLKAEPFERNSFKAARVAIFQLGNFGTAQKQLWEWNSGVTPE